MKYKKFLFCAILAAAAIIFGGCGNSGSNQSVQESLDKDASYALGMTIGSEFRDSMTGGNIFPNMDEFLKGMRDAMGGRNTRFSTSEANEILDKAFAVLMEGINEEAEQRENTFLVQNSQRPGITITSTGLQYEVITEGSGPKPASDDTVLINYEATFIDGRVFDSSYARGFPQDIELDQIIPGWTEGMQLMSVGSQYIFYIPSSIGYGDRGFTNPWTGEVLIPPYTPLVFSVELLEINPEPGEE